MKLFIVANVILLILFIVLTSDRGKGFANASLEDWGHAFGMIYKRLAVGFEDAVRR